jgi:hypothetical protein
MANHKTPGNMSKEEQEAAAHVAPVEQTRKGQPSEKRRDDAEKQVRIEDELEDNDQYPQ